MDDGSSYEIEILPPLLLHPTLWLEVERRQREIQRRKAADLPTAQEAFLRMMKTEIAPTLRTWNFKGSGQNFRLTSADYWLALGFQRSAWNDALRVRFTVNVSAVSHEAWRAARETDPQLPAEPNPSTHAGPGACERLGFLSRGNDHWWDVDVEAGLATSEVATDVLGDIENYALPWFENYSARNEEM